MKKVSKSNMFQWTLNGHPYWILASGSLVLLIVMLGVAAL